MSDSRGNRLGPYQLEARYRDTRETSRIYQARNTTTGAPALLLRPNGRHPEDAPLADWTVRVSSSVSPAYLALEVESAPATGEALAGEELEFMVHDLETIVGQALKRPATLGHLRSGQKPTRLDRTDWRPGVFGGVLVAALALLVVHATPTSSPPDLESEYARLYLVPAALDAGVGDLTGSVITDSTRSLPIALARPMPKAPFKGKQKLPPCDEDLEEEHFGGCWVETKKSAPCPDKLYEHSGKCYLPAAPAAREPASIFR